MKNHDCLESDNIPATDNYFSIQRINTYRLESDNMVKKIITIPTLCACGCNEVVWNGNTYRNGHTNKGKSTWAKGKHFSEEHKRKISEANRGQKNSEETRKKISAILKKTGGTPGSFKKEHKFSKESLEKMSLARRGKKPTEAHRRKLSEAFKKSPKWQAQIKKLHQNNRGRKVSIETRKKISSTHKGKIPSPKCNRGYKDYNSPFQGKITVRGSFEFAYAKYLDSINELWFYELWTFDLGDETYTPDFYLPRQEKFIEIKGYMQEHAKQKIERFYEEYPHETLEILYQDDLLELGCKIRRH